MILWGFMKGHNSSTVYGGLESIVWIGYQRWGHGLVDAHMARDERIFSNWVLLSVSSVLVRLKETGHWEEANGRDHDE